MKRNDERMENLTLEILSETKLGYDHYIDRKDKLELWQNAKNEKEFIKDLKFYLNV